MAEENRSGQVENQSAEADEEEDILEKERRSRAEIREGIEAARKEAASDEESEEAIRAMEAVNEKILKNSKVTRLIGTPLYFRKLPRSTERPVPAAEASYIKEITADYDWNINTGETVFVNSGSGNFNRQFEKARWEYVVLEKGEFPILLYDKTVRMTARYGFVLTNRYLHIHLRDYIPYKVRLSRISRVIVDFGYTKRDWSSISFMQQGSKKRYPFFQSLDAERVIELADVLLHMLYHLMPMPKADFEMTGTMPDSIADEFREDAWDEDAKKGRILRFFARLRRWMKMIRVMLFENEEPEGDVPAPVWVPILDGKKKSDDTGEIIEPAGKEADEKNPDSQDAGKKGKKSRKKGSKKDDGSADSKKAGGKDKEKSKGKDKNKKKKKGK
ncbi:MAG: hypothetical protein ACI4VM_04990 [Anaerovoracaceae bacterium]